MIWLPRLEKKLSRTSSMQEIDIILEKNDACWGTSFHCMFYFIVHKYWKIGYLSINVFSRKKENKFTSF